MKWRHGVMLMTVLALQLGGCSTIERNQVALGLCARTPGCTTSETRPEVNAPPQVRIMDGPPKEKVLKGGK